MAEKKNVSKAEQRVTIRDIARVAGVHFTTVGLALRGSSQLPESTRKRIRGIAEKMGYRPDPMLSALNAYRRKKNAPRYQATLAWINNCPQREQLHANAGFREYYEGARQRAEQMGYAVEEFWLAEPGMTPERLQGVLRARKIEALMLPPQPAPNMPAPLDCSDFAVVAFGYSLQPPIFHVVGNAQFHSMSLLLYHLRTLGYQRIGFFGEENLDQRVENSWLGGLALERWRNPQLANIPPLYERGGAWKRDLAGWLGKHRPDVVISHTTALYWLREMGCNIPAKLGFASLHLGGKEREISGIYQNNLHIGKAAVDLLISMLLSGERGIPAVPRRILVESVWNPGETLRPQKSSKPTARRK